jgi:hypothetical protein
VLFGFARHWEEPLSVGQVLEEVGQHPPAFELGKKQQVSVVAQAHDESSVGSQQASVAKLMVSFPQQPMVPWPKFQCHSKEVGNLHEYLWLALHF